MKGQTLKLQKDKVHLAKNSYSLAINLARENNVVQPTHAHVYEVENTWELIRRMRTLILGQHRGHACLWLIGS